MKIFLVSTFFHPVTGGVESHVYSLATELIKLGHEVTVLTSDSPKTGPRLPRNEINLNGIHIRRFFTWFSFSYYHKFFPGLFLFLMQNDFDVVHVHGFRKFETYFAWLAAKLKHKKIVLTTHNPFPTTSRSRFLSFMLWLHDVTLGRLLTRHLDKIITIVPSEQKIFRERFHVPKAKLVNIPNGLDTKFYTQGNKENFYKENNIDITKWRGMVMACGRLSYAKGIQNLKQAVAAMPDVLFYVAGGDDGYLAELKSLFVNNDNIIFNGIFLPPDKLIDIFNAADIFVFPSLHEAFGIVLLEAMAQGCAIVSTNCGGPSELITDLTGILIDPEDQQAWVDKITYLLEHPVIRKKMGREGQAFVVDFNWELLVQKIVAVYEQA